MLELGSGLGLTGISMLKQCQCKSYTFTDCHTQVLYLLARNIQLNLGANALLTNSSQSKTLEQSDLNASIDTNNSEDMDLDETPILRQIKRQLSLKSGKTPVEEDAGFSEFCEPPSDKESTEVTNSTVDESIDDKIEGCEELELSPVHWTESGCYLHALRGRNDVLLGRLDWEMPDDGLMEKLGAEADVIIAAGLSKYFEKL